MLNLLETGFNIFATTLEIVFIVAMMTVIACGLTVFLVVLGMHAAIAGTICTVFVIPAMYAGIESALIDD